ncbi:MAG: STAS domain-containing protein [Phycisphaerales bacterium]
MQFEHEKLPDGVLLLHADGGLDASNADELLDPVETLVDAGFHNIIVDCARLEHVSSAALAVLVSLHKRMAKRGGDVKLAAVRTLLAQILEIARLDQVFEIYPDVEQAHLAFRPKDARA